MACCGKPREDFKNKLNTVKENNMINKPVINKPIVPAVKKPKSLEELLKIRKDARDARITARNARIASRNAGK